jgi:hypothetical protein
MPKTIAILFFALSSFFLHACPTCLGRVQKGTPPLHSKEYNDYWTRTKQNQVEDGKDETRGERLKDGQENARTRMPDYSS